MEVLISTLLVGLIVVATFNGFSDTNRVSQDERAHDQATVLAAQSQEQLRSDPATTLNALASAAHEYTQTVGGTVYTITQAAKLVNGSGATAGCSNTKSENEASNYLSVTTSVTWATLKARNRSAVTQSSVITPPDGSGLEVDVTNQNSPEEGIPNVSVISTGGSATTGANGCVIYAGIPATTANIEAYKPGFVTPSGEHKVIAKEVSIAPNITTHYHIYLGEGGTITAKFMNQGKAATGDTFVAFNNKMGVTPEFEVGSPTIEYPSEAEYDPLPGTTTGGYAAEAKTAVRSPTYPTGNLFPFTNAWTVYAGDCTENNPSKYGSFEASKAIVPPGNNISTSVPTSFLKLNMYKGISGTVKETTPQEVKITNQSCATQIPHQVADNASESNYEHRQMTNGEGNLTYPYQPFGKFELCLAYNNAGTGTHSIYKTSSPYTNATEAGNTLTLYTGGGSNLGWTATSTGAATSKC
jgi:Tfp pilus assembly protein PilV